MNIPKHVIQKLVKINNHNLEIKRLSGEVIEWLESKGIDIDPFSSNTYSVLEMAEHGELPSDDHEEIKEIMIDNIKQATEESLTVRNNGMLNNYCEDNKK